MVNRIGVASLGLCISIIAIRTVRAIVNLGKRCMAVPCKDENEATKECEKQTATKTATVKQKKLGESAVEDDAEEEVIFTSTLDVGGGSDEGTEEVEEEVEGLGESILSTKE